MKLCEITGSRAIDVIAELIQPIADIASDRDNISHMFDVKPNDGETQGEANLRMIKENLPVLLKTYNAEILSILSIVNDIPAEEISLPEVVKGTLDLVNDSDFMSLFMSAVPKEARTRHTKSSKQ